MEEGHVVSGPTCAFRVFPGIRVLGAGKHSAAEGDREADGGAEAPERGAEGAREGLPAAALPLELRSLAAARTGGWLPAPVKPEGARRGPARRPTSCWFSPPGGGFSPHPCAWVTSLELRAGSSVAQAQRDAPRRSLIRSLQRGQAGVSVLLLWQLVPSLAESFPLAHA